MERLYKVGTLWLLLVILISCSAKRELPTVLTADQVPKVLKYESGVLRVLDKDPSGDPVELPQKAVDGYFAVSPGYLFELGETLKLCAGSPVDPL